MPHFYVAEDLIMHERTIVCFNGIGWVTVGSDFLATTSEFESAYKIIREIDVKA